MDHVFIPADIVLSALETFLFKGLYKFTYLLHLLTYLPPSNLRYIISSRKSTYTFTACDLQPPQGHNK